VILIGDSLSTKLVLRDNNTELITAVFLKIHLNFELAYLFVEAVFLALLIEALLML
jgi:hypothetical protein